jgi:hypothetical protein
MTVAGSLWKISSLVGVHLAMGLVFEVIDFEENCLLFGCWSRSMSRLGVVVVVVVIIVIVVACRRGLG